MKLAASRVASLVASLVACVVACVVASLAAVPRLALGAEAAQQVVVIGSPIERRLEDAPYAIGVVEREALRAAGPGIGLGEALVRVPGLAVAERHNHAQDVQLSARGFGARSTFGVRGLRLYADGIPATMPDGQGQVAHFDLADAERIEVLRGPYSALYGASSGGVVALVTRAVRERRAEAGLDIGSFGLRQVRASLATPFAAPGGDAWVRLGAQAMQVDGFRPHSAARRRLATLRAGWQGGGDRLALHASAFEQPADDPLGLTREAFDADPDSTAPQATTFDTRKRASQQQLGASWQHDVSERGVVREARLAAWAGRRSVTQWLAIPEGPQANPRHGGGVVDFDRDYGGVDARLAGRAGGVDWIAGAAVEKMTDERRGFENFVGDRLGVTGAPRRDERNRARSADAYAQAEVGLGEGVAATVGVRSGRVTLASRDRWLANGDDSGERRYRYTQPVLGLAWRASPALLLHASAARAAEAPTLGEVAYRADGTGGFNDTLDAQASRQLEIGARWRGDALELDAVAFQAEVDDEIGVVANAGGRSAFDNVGRTRRRGVELAARWQPRADVRATLALTTLDARYRDGFLTCAGVPCTSPTAPVARGHRSAGTQRARLFAELAWSAWALEWRAATRTAVNDRNTDFAPGWGTLALRWQHERALGGGWWLQTLVRLENLGDRRYAGSVIVNDGNGRWFEPAPPRHALLGLRLVMR